jgi:hypothetical protein
MLTDSGLIRQVLGKLGSHVSAESIDFVSYNISIQIESDNTITRRDITSRLAAVIIALV